MTRTLPVSVGKIKYFYNQEICWLRNSVVKTRFSLSNLFFRVLVQNKHLLSNC
jgi:hypothetical protein